MKQAIPLTEVVADTLAHMRIFLETLDAKRYRQPLDLFSQSTIGQHTRHVVEFFQCLLIQADEGLINYESRCRDFEIQENPQAALEAIEAIIQRLRQQDLPTELELLTQYGPDSSTAFRVPTTLDRELIYNIEHAIHHMAILKIGLKVMAPEINLPEEFGVAPSTIQHRRQQSLSHNLTS